MKRSIRQHRHQLLAAWATLFCFGGAAHAEDGYFPPAESQGGWRAVVGPNATPTESQQRQILDKTGLDWDILSQAWDYDINTVGAADEWPRDSRKSLLVIRHGWIAFEQYRSNDGSYNKDTRVAFASGTKTLVGVSLARLFSQGRCKDTDYLYQYMPESWAGAEPARKKIQIRHVLSMSSGLEPYDGPYEPKSYARIIRNLGVIAEPGTQWFYNTGALDLLNYVIADRSGMPMEEFLNSEIMQPIHGGDVTVEPRHKFEGHGFCSFYRLTPRDYARIGYLFLQQGRWDDRQMIDRDVVSLMTSQPEWLLNASVGISSGQKEAPNENYAYTFWLNKTGEMPGVPADSYMASGGNHKMIVMPSLDMIVARVGNYVHDTDEVNQIYGVIRRAVTDQPAEALTAVHRPQHVPTSPAAASGASSAYADIARADPKSLPSGRHLELEAESGRCTEPMRVDEDTHKLSVQFVWIPRDRPANYDVPGGPGSVGIAFHLPDAGDYNIWIRTIAPDSHSDSYYLAMDGEVIDRPWNTEAVPQSQVWQWNKVREGKRLEAGNHLFECRHRESGIKLDKIVITANPKFIPE